MTSYHNPNPPTMDFGKLMPTTEYNQKNLELYDKYANKFSKEQQLERLREELELHIDHNLGMDFPQARRETLWQVKKAFEAKRGWILVWAVVSSPLAPFAGLSKTLVRAYVNVLSYDELRAMFDLSPEDLNKLLGKRLQKTLA